jgi:hypothetical protein
MNVFRRMEAEIERLRAALKEIRDMDYRGNKHSSHYIAKQALEQE